MDQIKRNYRPLRRRRSPAVQREYFLPHHAEPKPQELPECSRYPGRVCPGECQYLLNPGVCLYDTGADVTDAPMGGWPGAPGFWMDERSGALRRAVLAYLERDAPLTEDDLDLIRAYLRQWIAGEWQGDEMLAQLRAGVDSLRSREAIDLWWHRAVVLGLDPF